MTLDEFIEKTCARPLPANQLLRIKIFAKELAEGASEGLWSIDISRRKEISKDSSFGLFKYWPDEFESAELDTYILKRWERKFPDLKLLLTNGFLTDEGDFKGEYRITSEAFRLINEVDDTNIFISYKRSESSAFALLVLSRLKVEGLEPFLDMSLIPGEIWHAGLQARIQKSDYLVMLLGRQTLKSEVCLQELKWAIDAKLTIIPVWHNKFVYKSEKWNLPPEVDSVLNQTHAIRVKEESALDYNNAIVELLNRFGITP